ncbi:MAG TPA: DUF3084 domain-containing protein [bacterium]|nr:DUF3084 domain-containing protein [bacterium]
MTAVSGYLKSSEKEAILAMLSGIALVLLLIVLSGLIAFIGDYVGRKAGKRRITFLNLRPRQASKIITVLTGAMIVSVTLGVLFLFSSYARTSFFGLQRLISELKHQKKEIQVSTIKYRREEARLSAEVEQSRRESRAVAEKLQRNQSELDKILGEINMKSVKLTELQETHKKTSAELKKLSSETSELRAKKNKLEKDIAASVDRLSKVSVETLYGDILYHKDQPLALVTVSSDISESDFKARLMLMINTILSDAVQRGAIVDKDINAIFNEQFKGLLDVIEHTHGQLIIEARAANNVFKGQQMYIKLRPIRNEIVFKKGEVIVEENLTANLKREEAGKILMKMLSEVSSEARSRGMITSGESQKVGSVTAKKYLEVLDAVTDSPKKKNVKVIALDNTYVSDQLRVDFLVN